MHSLNSLQFNRENGPTQQVETTATKPNLQMESETSICLLNNKKLEIQSPEQGQNVVFKPFAKLIHYFHIAAFVLRLQRYFKPDGSFMEKHFDIIKDLGSGIAKDFLAFKSKKPSLAVVNFETVSWKVHFNYNYRQAIKKGELVALKIFNQIPLIEPSNKIKIIWDVLLNIMRIYLIYIIPIIITFENLLKQWQLVQLIFGLCLLIDMALRHITIYFDQGLPVKDRYQILRNQDFFESMIEIAGISGMIIFASFHEQYDDIFILSGGYIKLILLLVFYQIKNILVFINNISQSMSFGKATTSIIELSRLIGVQLILQHVFSCIWIIIARYSQIQNLENWISQGNALNYSWEDLYIESLYFISITMFTVGYGDAHPFNKIEKLFTIIFVFLCAFQLSYSLDTIGFILQQLKKSSETINKNLAFINQYMHNKNISRDLQIQIREYLQYFWYQEQTKYTLQQQKIFGQLSEDLRRQLAYESNIVVFKKCKILSQEFSHKFQNELLKQIQFQNYQPSIQIHIKRDDDFYLYIIESGKVDVYEKKDAHSPQTLIGALQQGDTFNLESFIVHQSNNRLVYKSQGFVSVLAIPYKLFYELLHNNSKDLEKFWELRRQIQFNQIQYSHCVTCDSKRHVSDQCRQVHFVADKEKVLKSFIYNQYQERQFYTRNRNRLRNFFNAKLDINFFKEAATLVKQSNESQIFHKFNDFDEINREESKPALKIKHDADSLSLLIKDFESKNFISDAASEQIMQYSHSRSKGLDTEEFNNLQIINQKLRNKLSFTKNEIEQMEFTVKKLESQTLPFQVDFEKFQEYQIYNSAHNISLVLKKISNVLMRKIQHRQSNSIESFKLSYSSHLLRYLLFPFDFINQYRSNPQSEMKKSEKMQQIHQNKRRMSRELLLKRIGRKIIFRRALQVFPVQQTE